MAGLDAGHAYNEFPLMGGQLVPAEYWALDGWRNFFENTAAVQFDHRLLATTTLLSVAATWLAHRAAPLPTSSKRLLHALMAVTTAQVCLAHTHGLQACPLNNGVRCLAHVPGFCIATSMPCYHFLLLHVVLAVT